LEGPFGGLDTFWGYTNTLRGLYHNLRVILG
jgi:hypothetical protein